LPTFNQTSAARCYGDIRWFSQVGFSAVKFTHRIKPLIGWVGLLVIRCLRGIGWTVRYFFSACLLAFYFHYIMADDAKPVMSLMYLHKRRLLWHMVVIFVRLSGELCSLGVSVSCFAWHRIKVIPLDIFVVWCFQAKKKLNLNLNGLPHRAALVFSPNHVQLFIFPATS
jgi:hypothetical protein